MGKYAQIRPYHDEEVRPVLDRLITDKEFIEIVAKLRLKSLYGWFPWLSRNVASLALRREFSGIKDVYGFQMLIGKYMRSMISSTTKGLSYSGLDTLEKDPPYLFMSNHRDIALDPAFVNFSRYLEGYSTVRIAIGDNLLTKQFASDLMRLNKSFIVPRSAKGREMLTAYRLLSSYIRHSIVEDSESIWIAQREGRAKDGLDRTEPAILKMLSMSMNKKTETLGDHVEHLNIVPVSVSYELDPCDASKAKELFEKAEKGQYTKQQHEDVMNIGLGISGQKGHVHVSFGEPLRGQWDSVEAVAEEIDRQVIANYVLHPTNFFAYKALHGEYPDLPVSKDNKAFEASQFKQEEQDFAARISAMPEEHRSYALGIYANPIKSKLDAIERR